ncbi:ABC transporter ATP-binding protein [Seongchinamella unica]|uniref:ABC transporter ATP-binding protein n=1 Tax=Seongchinamella unica TaxID=2547392 RepID=A0A4R5LQQ1_9GAMM|nr:ABC transporter ATP-binding protein [Seongchinamella unica]TDG12902.1 ABC transporter ATP-binding protein [Seongchinamella unica]
MNLTPLLGIITPHRRVLYAILALMLASAGLNLLQPWLAGKLTEAVLGNTGAWNVQQLLLLWLPLLALRAIFEFGSRYRTGSAGEEMSAQLRLRVFQHLQALPLSYYQQRRKGEVLTLLGKDADIISHFVTSTLVSLLPLALTFIGALVMMLFIDPLIALLAALLLPLYYLAMKLLGRHIRPVSRAWVSAYSDLISFFEQHLSMKPAVKSFAREELEESRFMTHNQYFLSLARRQLLLEALLPPVIGLLAGLGLLLLLWLGSARIEAGQLSPANMVSLLLYAMLMSQPLRSLANVYGQVQQTLGAAERILQLLAEQPEPDDRGLAVLPPVRGDILFDQVYFRYPQGKPVLVNRNLHIRAGETVALVGPNGAGKSTIVFLLQRMADPDQGRILIDNIDIASVSLSSLRRQIGLVAQHTLLVNGSVADNIAWGCPGVDKSAIEAAARKAMADGFIAALPEAYDTLIGDQGIKLSGGQRQRISLARTLLLDPPILILDEATAMFDPEGEADLFEACRQLMADRTVIIITHRPAALALADRVLTIEPVTDNGHGGTFNARAGADQDLLQPL